MLKKVLAFMVMLYAVMAMAAVDVNKATEAELDGVKGIGPVTSKLIMSERKKGAFKDWDDFITRVKGVGEIRAAKLSADGLTVGSASFKPAAGTEKSMPAKAADSGKAAADKTKDVAKSTTAATKVAAKETKEMKDTVTSSKAGAAKPAASAVGAASAAKK